ncbi:MAG: RNA polymerase sigma factor [Planctomycetota bacterium]
MGALSAHFPGESIMMSEESVAQQIDRDEFAALVDQHIGTLRFIAAARVGASHADDVVQKAATTALRRLGDFEPGTSFAAWMGAFVRNEARNARRAERRYRLRLAGFRERRAPRGDTNTIEPETLAQLRRCLEGLTETQRECILLRVVGDHSYEQIAAITGEPATTARSHVHRSRARLAKCLERKQEGDSHDV